MKANTFCLFPHIFDVFHLKNSAIDLLATWYRTVFVFVLTGKLKQLAIME